MVPQRAVDARLVASAVFAEPVDHVRVKAQRQLLFDWPVEQAALRAGSVQDFRDVACVDVLFGYGGEGRKLPARLLRQVSGNSLLHSLSFQSSWLSARLRCVLYLRLPQIRCG